MRIQHCEFFQESYQRCLDCGALQLANAQELQHERNCDKDADQLDEGTGYFYWACSAGCLPDSEPVGPFASHAEALAAAREEVQS